MHANGYSDPTGLNHALYLYLLTGPAALSHTGVGKAGMQAVSTCTATLLGYQLCADWLPMHFKHLWFSFLNKKNLGSPVAVHKEVLRN